MLPELTVSSSGLAFTNSNYNYDNANANVGSYLCIKRSINLAHMAKNYLKIKSAGTPYGKAIF
jgi:hypothetical protein